MIPANLVEAAQMAVQPEQTGRVRSSVGLRIEVEGISAAIGDLVTVDVDGRALPAEVVAIESDTLVCLPLGRPEGVRHAQRATVVGGGLTVPIGEGLAGRVLDGLGRPIDGRPLPAGIERVPLAAHAPGPLTRRPVSEQLPLGVKSLDTLLACGRGQRLGIFAGSGVGKSTLLGMLARGTAAECTVIALVGERGREAEEFVRERLGSGLSDAVVVVATSDQPAMVRMQAAFVATRIAEGFRDQGKDVLLLLDSLTRFAMAQREVGLAAGEPPATRGYPPSVFSLLATLLERAGGAERGSITGLYTVLVEGDDMDEPIADTARSILDGHVVLSRLIAQMGEFPAVDILSSVSRLANGLHTPLQRQVASRARRLMALYEESRDLIEVGAYHAGASPDVDEAIAARGPLRTWLAQSSDEIVPVGTAWDLLAEAVGISTEAGGAT